MSAQRVDTAVRARIHALLADAFGSRLQGVVLYGSEARGTAEPDSDADLIERPIHALPVDATAYAEGEFSLYRNARKEGVLV